MNAAAAQTLEQSMREHQRFLWGLCYRMTGVAADADDLVQDTFARALEAPPRLDAPLKPWLTRVAVNLARDALRRRKKAPYVGPWLPSPIETAEEESATATAEPASTEGRYDLLESVSFAFLLALEALSPQQRAVLLLRDVFDYSVREAADALGLSEANVKTTHLRGRRAMAAYDASRTVPTKELQARNKTALEALLTALIESDMPKVEALLSASAKGLSDGGGEFLAARVPVLGAKKVATFLARISAMRGPPLSAELRTVNGFAALVATYPASEKKTEAPRIVMRVDVGADGAITEVHTVLATHKLTAVRF